MEVIYFHLRLRKESNARDGAWWLEGYLLVLSSGG